jgi:hypothetical protein
MDLYSDTKLLEESLYEVSESIDQDIKQRAAAEIKKHVEAAARELSLERFANFENELYQKILSFVGCSSIDEQVGGILVIKELVDSTSAIAESKLARFGSALSYAIENSTDYSLIEVL